MKALSLSMLLALCCGTLLASGGENNDENLDTKIYLECCSDASTIVLEEAAEALSIRIYAPSGDLVYSKAESEPVLKDTKINASEVGCYWVVCTSKEKVTTITLRTDNGLEEA